MASPNKEDSDSVQQPKTSKQLLHVEKFAGITLEQKLQITDGGKPMKKPSFRLGPIKSSVLQRVEAFLPQLAEANEKLKDRPPTELSMDNVDSDDEGPMIEMDLYMVPKVGSDDSSSEEEENDSEDESEDGSDSSEEDDTGVRVKILSADRERSRKRKLICELDEEDSKDMRHCDEEEKD